MVLGGAPAPDPPAHSPPPPPRFMRAVAAATSGAIVHARTHAQRLAACNDERIAGRKGMQARAHGSPTRMRAWVETTPRRVRAGLPARLRTRQNQRRMAELCPALQLCSRRACGGALPAHGTASDFLGKSLRDSLREFSRTASWCRRLAETFERGRAAPPRQTLQLCTPHGITYPRAARPRRGQARVELRRLALLSVLDLPPFARGKSVQVQLPANP